MQPNANSAGTLQYLPGGGNGSAGYQTVNNGAFAGSSAPLQGINVAGTAYAAGGNGSFTPQQNLVIPSDPTLPGGTNGTTTNGTTTTNGNQQSSDPNHGISNPQVNQFASDGFRYVGNGQWAAPAGYGQSTNQYGQTADQVAQAQSVYDQVVQTLKGFIPILQGQADTSTQAVNNSVGQTVNQAQTGEDTLNNQTNNAIAGQSGILKSALGGNNSYAASFGSGLSSFGEGLNNQTYQNYGNTIGGLQNNQQTGVQQFEQSKVQAQQWGANQAKAIQDQLKQGLQQVVLNVNQTDIQKAQAVIQIQQQAQAQMNTINSTVAQLQANISVAQQQALSNAAFYAQQNPQLAANIRNISDNFASGSNKNIGNTFPGATGLYGSDKLYGSNMPNQFPQG